MIQKFLNVDEFGDICIFLFRDKEYFSKYLKGYGVPGTRFPASMLLNMQI